MWQKWKSKHHFEKKTLKPDLVGGSGKTTSDFSITKFSPLVSEGYSLNGGVVRLVLACLISPWKASFPHLCPLAFWEALQTPV